MEHKVCLIDGTPVDWSKKAKYLPCDEHPYDHYMVMAQLNVPSSEIETQIKLQQML